METHSAPQPEKEGRNFQPWGDVTDPNKHDPNKFRYLVHGINPNATLTMGMFGIELQREQPPISKEDGDQTINLFRQPERLSERVALSCSLVDQEHHGTWGSAGLIVESPPENVCITSSSDIGAIVMDKRLLENQARQRFLLTADQLLTQTYSSSYNEVVVIANENGQKIYLAGFFYKVTDSGEPLDENLTARFRQHAERLGLPLVTIREPNRYSEQKVIRTEDSLSVYFNGRYYGFKGNTDRFKTLDQKGNNTFISPDKLEEVLHFLENNGLSEVEIQELRKEYFEADRMRQQPKIKFDEQGQVLNIEKLTGYGKDEKVLRIGQTGYTSWAYVITEAQQFREMMADPGRPQMESFGPKKMLSPKEVKNIIQEIINYTSDEDRAKIEAWYQTVKGSVAKYWQQNQSRSKSYIEPFEFPEFPESTKKLNFDFTKLLGELSKKSDDELCLQNKDKEDKEKN